MEFFFSGYGGNIFYGGVLVLLICVQILVCLDCLSHGITKAKIQRKEHTWGGGCEVAKTFWGVVEQ